MAKGQICPSCGNQTFHEDGPIYKCSTCDGIGWLRRPGSPGAGKGTECGYCGKSTLREIYSDHNLTIFTCTACKAIFIPR
jgi:ribosomal protein L37AE/L43A